MTQATYRAVGNVVDHTPGSALTAGDVVILGDRVGIAKSDIAASALGALAVCGLFSIVKVTGAISQWARVFWDADGDPDGGTAGTGALSTDPSVGPFAGIAVAAAASGDDTVDVLLNSDRPTDPLPTVITDPGDAGAIPVNEGSGVVNLVTAGAETRTLAAPLFEGQTLQLNFQTDGGNCVVTASAGVNQTGNNTLTIADAGDHMLLQAGRSGASLVWRVVANDGVALTTV